MSFDPSLPAPNSKIRSGELRNQFNALKAISDGLQAAMTQLQAQLDDLGEQIANLPAGPQGPAGADGQQGPQGETGPAGPAGPTAVIVDQNDPGGAEGTIWIRPSDGNVAVRVNGGWDNRGTMKGDKGDRGDDGAPGEEGPTGPMGEVSTQQMNDAIAAEIAGTANSLNGVSPMSETSDDPVLQAAIDKINEVINSAHR